jgi:hypothetical protein
MKKIWLEMTGGDNRAALGQPVLLSPDITVLRIALGAHMVVAALSPETESERAEVLARLHAEDVTVVTKLKTLCAQRWGVFNPPAVL